MADYLLAEGDAEFDRLSLQSRVWATAGRRLLSRLGPLEGARVLEVGCGVLGWLELLAQAVGPRGRVVGTDVNPRFLEAARRIEGPIDLMADDLFDSKLPPRSFDLVHARFQLAPLGRVDEQLAAHRRLLKPGGILVLEEPDSRSWQLHPAAPACDRLLAEIVAAFQRSGGDFDAGRKLPGWLRAAGLEPSLSAEIVALEPGHPYLRLPLQFASSLASLLRAALGEATMNQLLADAERELADPARWGTTFTLIQCWCRA